MPLLLRVADVTRYAAKRYDIMPPRAACYMLMPFRAADGLMLLMLLPYASQALCAMRYVTARVDALLRCYCYMRR